jgi:hypothetical protein
MDSNGTQAGLMNATTVILLAGGLLLAPLLVVAEILRRRHVMLWLPGYWRSRREAEAAGAGPTHVMFCFVDHFEPGWKRPGQEVEAQRVARWSSDYPAMARQFRDADGRHPCHTFFYPEEEYREEHLSALSELCAQGFGEIEVHLHHDRDTEEGLRAKLMPFVDVLHRQHGALPVDPVTGKVVWGFIHGNWCLDNSRPDGRWCGVNNELIVLKECGCYADFTMPSAPSDTQTSIVNSLYYATDDPLKPKSHDSGLPVQVGRPAQGDLLMVQGVLGFDWSSRKFGILPRIENSDVRAGQPPTPARVDQWVRLAPRVRGRPDWRFIKVHTHGAPEGQAKVLLGGPIQRMHEHLTSRYNDGRNHVLHYVSAREMYNIIKAAEAGKSGNPNAYRDFLLPAPRFRRRAQ